MKFFYTHQCGFGLILLFIFFSTATAKAQNTYKLSGQVTDTTGQAIPGVHIQRINTTNGTTTDFDGNYNIQVTGTDRLSFTYLGYQAQTIAVNNRKLINVQLSPSTEALDEVVINAGYYRVKDRERTGSIEKVTSEDIELQPVTNPIEALQGRMAGVEVVQKSGVRGLATSIQIRGQNSLRSEGNYPLYIVDGVPINSSPINSSGLLTNIPGIDPLNTMNISNIESIEILKDADATAIYGSRGANGVILITTKKGTNMQGKLRVEANFYKGVSEASNKMDLLNTQQYLSMRREAFANDGVEPTDLNAADLKLWDQNRYTDWQDVFFGNRATIDNASISLSSGNETTSFVIGGQYQKEGSVFPGDLGYKKATANINLNHRSLDNKFQIHFTGNYGVDHNNLFNDSFVDKALSLAPNAPRLYNYDGSLNWEDSTWTNPFASLEKEQEVKAKNLITNMSLSYDFGQGLSFKTNLGYNFLISQELIKLPKTAYNPLYWPNVSANSTHSSTQRDSWIIEPQLDYNIELGHLGLDALAGFTFQNSSTNNLISVGQGYSHPSLIGNLEAADNVRVNLNKNTEYRYNAVYARIGTNWKHKYFLNLTGRRDGSSRFGPDKRFANFGAIGAAWIFTEESFFNEHFNWLSFGKIRGSYGTTGNDQIPDYGYADTYQPTPGPGGLYPVKLTNPDYSWEVNKKLETALELSFLKNRIRTEIAWYRNRSSNQLVGYPLPATTGFASVQANLPATVENKAWEISLSTKNINNEDFKWQSHINLTIPKNKLLEFENIEETSYSNIYKVGEPLNISLLYQYDGIDQSTGFHQIKDINGDGVYNTDDQVVVKNLGRKFYGGLQNSFSYKNLNLQFLLQYVKQENRTYFGMTNPPGFDTNQPVSVLNRWRNQGDITNTQKFTQGFDGFMPHYYATQSELAVGDASFLRLKSISLGYHLPSSLMGKLKIEEIKLFAHAQNLLTITDYLGLDPEGGTSLPPLRTITAGVQIKF
ncbi:MAG: SusC/RagA family TonB-linked outer membrane protein [Lactococcus lactis]|nr:SusC/RagA family TonB-linked outer membrane protein [Lactococcus lactis]